MTTTVATIAAKAFDGVAAKISGVIQSCTLTRTTQGAYDPSTGSYSTTTSTDTGRGLFDTSTKIEDALPGYIAGPTEKLVWIEGLDTLTPKENDGLTVGASSYTVMHVGDIVGAGSFYAATVVNS
ncbi:hypothetical protein [Rhodobium gokarnense]|uniref:Uncharacterized protein n=1 Tax=Rhodobium gokarnense TaxID=364296 RepID=A0ABT3HH65_9HYPH|nr:hypothetical protein [Rhodobium gokarnense]MCW2309722.1 hypothetical protein [Rhodobium gokarnense]